MFWSKKKTEKKVKSPSEEMVVMLAQDAFSNYNEWERRRPGNSKDDDHTKWLVRKIGKTHFLLSKDGKLSSRKDEKVTSFNLNGNLILELKKVYNDILALQSISELTAYQDSSE